MSEQNQATTYTGLQVPDGSPMPQNRLTHEWLLSLIGGLVYLAINIAAGPAEVLLRHKFGERYLALPMVICTYLYTLIFVFAANRVPLPFATTDESNNFMALFAHLYLILAAIHLISIRLRNLRGEQWHSMSAGLPIPILTRAVRTFLEGVVEPLVPRSWSNHGAPLHIANRAEIVTINFVEPLLFASTGLLVIPLLGSHLQTFWLWTFLALCIKGVFLRHYSRIEILNMIDQHIESTHKSALLSGIQGPAESAGYTVWAPPMTPAAQQAYRDTVANLPPRLRAIVDDDAEPTQETS